MAPPGLELVHETRAEEGDLVRLLSRTGEALLQIAGLRETHPQAADLAARAAEIVLQRTGPVACEALLAYWERAALLALSAKHANGSSKNL